MKAAYFLMGIYFGLLFGMLLFAMTAVAAPSTCNQVIFDQIYRNILSNKYNSKDPMSFENCAEATRLIKELCRGQKSTLEDTHHKKPHPCKLQDRYLIDLIERANVAVQNMGRQ